MNNWTEEYPLWEESSPTACNAWGEYGNSDYRVTVWADGETWVRCGYEPCICEDTRPFRGVDAADRMRALMIYSSSPLV